jgi:hypothetical protein
MLARTSVRKVTDHPLSRVIVPLVLFQQVLYLGG